MANANPQYHQWIFRKPASTRPRDHIQLAYSSAPYEMAIIYEPRAELERHLSSRKRIEILEEARLLKHNVTDLW